MRRAVLTIVFLCAALARADAQQTGQVSLTLPTAKGTITAHADRINGNFKARGATLEGHVVIHDGAVTIGAPVVHVHFSDDKVDRVTAEQAVVIDTPSGAATAAGGVYDVETKTVILSGNVVLTEKDNVIRGHTLRYDTVTGVATMQGKKGSRVQALVSTKVGR